MFSYDYYNISHKIDDLDKFKERHWYETGGTPIWLINEQAGGLRRSAAMHWPLADADWPTSPHKPSVYRLEGVLD